MSADDRPQPGPNDSNNPSDNRASTWEDESQRTTSFERLSPESKEEFLSTVGFLFGVCVDCNAGPTRTTSRVAFFKAGGRACFREMAELETESITTQNERESNYVHRGWSLSSMSSTSPWIESRIANSAQTNRSEKSITKRIVTLRLQVKVLLEDISPVTEFEEAVKEALKLPTRYEASQALYRVFSRWGDVIPLSFDVGTSLTATDSISNYEADPVHLSEHELSKLMDHKTAKVLTVGRALDTTQDGERSWLYDSKIPVGRWAQVRITKVVPVTALLSAELQEQLERLHSSLIAYRPLPLRGDTNNGYAFDDVSHAMKTIKSIIVRCTDRINSLRVAYSDGIFSPYHGSNNGFATTFDLNSGKHISEVHIWEDSDGICLIKFLTTAGRMSHAFGGATGAPAILYDPGGFLTAFTGKVKNDSIYQLQGIWRHDIRRVDLREQKIYSQYYGTGQWGQRFDDLPLLEHPNTTVSRIKVLSDKRIYAIQASIRMIRYPFQPAINLLSQLTYSYREGDRTVTFDGPHNGGTEGKEGTFDLSPGEYVTAIRGRLRPNLWQLCFATNLGRASSIFGSEEGSEFVCQAPLDKDGKAMRLYSVSGRCGCHMEGLIFAWAVV